MEIGEREAPFFSPYISGKKFNSEEIKLNDKREKARQDFEQEITNLKIIKGQLKLTDYLIYKKQSLHMRRG